jgi:hypothetical protein
MSEKRNISNNNTHVYKILLLLPYLYIAKLTESITIAVVLMFIMVTAHNYIIEKVAEKIANK